MTHGKNFHGSQIHMSEIKITRIHFGKVEIIQLAQKVKSSETKVIFRL